ncbi:MAG: aminodeoxychorismate/anthranilate synthase component II [Candidatus Hydrothermarchaeales archaeon]
MSVLIIDNIDSFVYNLYQYVGELREDVVVKRNHISVDEVEEINPDKIILSPGPGIPERAGNSIAIIKRFSSEIPILGVCLGHQAIGAAFGAKVGRAKNLMHGKTSEIEHDGRSIYRDVSNPLTATRYHSLAIEDEGFPRELEVTSRSKGDDIIMGVRHKKYAVEGIQFHPESILTSEGKHIMRNFLELER